MAIRGAETFSRSENSSDRHNILALGATHIDREDHTRLITIA
jgi:hypothetical protein